MKKYLYLMLFLATVLAGPGARADGGKIPNVAVFFEIPVTDFQRAVTFYEKITNMKLGIKNGDGWAMAFFPESHDSVSGALSKSPDYKPSADGTIVYLNGGADLQVILDRVEGAGGKILVPKTLISPEIGYFGQFLDTEGNRVGLYTPGSGKK